MQLYLFNHNNINPYIILIVRVINNEENTYILNNFENIFDILVVDNIIKNDDILVFSLIKEYNKKIENFIKPYSDKNHDKINSFNNDIIINILQNVNCNIMFDCYDDIIKKKICNLNMEFLIDKYI